MRLSILAILLVGLASLATAQWPEGATEIAILVGTIGIPAFTILRNQYIMRTAVEETLAQLNDSTFDPSYYNPPVAVPALLPLASLPPSCANKTPLEAFFRPQSCSSHIFQDSSKLPQPTVQLLESIVESQAESLWWEDLLNHVGWLFQSFRFLFNDIYADVSRLFVFAVGFFGIRVGTALALISFLLGLKYHFNKHGTRLRDAFIVWSSKWIYGRFARVAVLLWPLIIYPFRTIALQSRSTVWPFVKAVAKWICREVIILVKLTLNIGELCSQLVSAAVDGYLKPAFDYWARLIFISQVVCWVFLLLLGVILAAIIACICILCCMLLHKGICETLRFICKLFATLYHGLKLVLSDCWDGVTYVAPDILHGTKIMFGDLWHGLRNGSSQLCPMVAHMDQYRAEMNAVKRRQDQQDLQQEKQARRCREQAHQINVLISEKQELLAKLTNSIHSHEELREYKALFQKIVHTGAVANVERLATGKQDGLQGTSFWRQHRHATLSNEELQGRRLRQLRGEPNYALESSYFDKKEEVLALHGRDNDIEDRVHQVEAAIEKTVEAQKESDQKTRGLENELDRLRKKQAAQASRKNKGPASIPLPPSPTIEAKVESPKKGKACPVEKVAGSHCPARQTSPARRTSPAPRSSAHIVSAASAQPIAQDNKVSSTPVQVVKDTEMHAAGAPAEPAEDIKVSSTPAQTVEDTEIHPAPTQPAEANRISAIVAQTVKNAEIYAAAAPAQPGEDNEVSATIAQTVEDTEMYAAPAQNADANENSAAPAQVAKNTKISVDVTEPMNDSKPEAVLPFLPAKNVVGTSIKYPKISSNDKPSTLPVFDWSSIAKATPIAPAASSSPVTEVKQIDIVAEAVPTSQPAHVTAPVEEVGYIAGLRTQVDAAKKGSSIDIAMDEELCRLGSTIHDYEYLGDERGQGHLARFKKDFPEDQFEKLGVSAQGHACGLRALFASWNAQFWDVEGYHYLTFERIVTAAWLYMANNNKCETNFGNDDLEKIMRDAITVVSNDDTLSGPTNLGEYKNLVLGAFIEGGNGAIIWNDDDASEKVLWLHNDNAQELCSGQAKTSIFDHWSGLAPVDSSDFLEAGGEIPVVTKTAATVQRDSTSGPDVTKEKKKVRFAENLTDSMMSMPSTAADGSAAPNQTAPASIFRLSQTNEASQVTFDLGVKPVKPFKFADTKSPFPNTSSVPKSEPTNVATEEQTILAPAPVPVSSDADMMDASDPNVGDPNLPEPDVPSYNSVHMSDAPQDVQQSTAAPIQVLAPPISQPDGAEIEMDDNTPEAMPTKAMPVSGMNEVAMGDAPPQSLGPWDVKPPPKPASVVFKLPPKTMPASATNDVVMEDASSQPPSRWNVVPPPKPKNSTKSGLAGSIWANFPDDSVKASASKDVDMSTKASSKEPPKSGFATTPSSGSAKGKSSPFGRPQSETEKQDAIARDIMKDFGPDFTVGGVKLLPTTKPKSSTVLVPASPTKETPASHPEAKDQAAVDKLHARIKECEVAIAAKKEKATIVNQQALPSFGTMKLPSVQPVTPAQPSKLGTGDLGASAGKGVASGLLGSSGGAAPTSTTAVDAGMPSSGSACTNSSAPTAAGGVQTDASKSVLEDVQKWTMPKNFKFVADKSDSESDADSDGSYEDCFGPKPPATDDEDEEADLKLKALRAKAKARPAAVKKAKPRTIKQVGKTWAKKGLDRQWAGILDGEELTDEQAEFQMELLLGDDVD